MTMTRRALLLWLSAVPMPMLLAAACGSPPSQTAAPTAGAAPTAPPASPPTVAPTLIRPTPAPTAVPTLVPTAVPPPAPTSAPTLAPVAAAPPQALAPTPACADDDDPTPAQTEGPYFTRNSPERASLLEAGARTEKMVLSGYVFGTTCAPVDRALLDFWQADDVGQYDTAGYRYRGHQFTDAQGRFTLETVLPGLYPGRTRHIHVKVQAPNRPVLTTQLYFPGEARNRSDGIYRSELEMQIEDTPAGKAALFNFVVNAG